jgi:outer membrane lipoprotein-sorting protein
VAYVHSKESVDNIIKNVQKKYEKIEVLKVEFRQVNRFKLTGIENEIFGSILISQKNKFRIETEDQIMASDGESFWRFNKLENQVLIDHAKKSQQDVFLNNFLYQISDYYYSQIVSEQKRGKNKIFEIKLTPKNGDDSFFSYIKVWLMDKSWELEKVIYVDFNDNEVEYQIEKVEQSPEVSRDPFRFEIPQGTEVVDLRF